ncbi:LapA family protein, partial [Shewanella sp. C31]|nr:LapA family protein [Shewanella electrica]
VMGAGLYLYLSLPYLQVPTPWGPWPLFVLLPGAYALGFLVGGLYALAFWWAGLAERRALLREVRRLQGEVNALKRERIEEI